MLPPAGWKESGGSRRSNQGSICTTLRRQPDRPGSADETDGLPPRPRAPSADSQSRGTTRNAASGDQQLYRQEVETIIDVDLANYFGTIDHGLLEVMLREKIQDERFLRYVKRMFKAGVLTAGELTVSEEGVAQGSCGSPILANIFAHHVLDTWFEEVVKAHCRGQVALYRYADDAVICCQYGRDAERILRALRQRLAKYRLRLHEEKTRLVPFSKQAARH